MNKTFTYFAFLIAVSVAIVTPALGDTMLVFSDGSRHVWSNMRVSGDQACTELSFGTYCVQRADVILLKTVAPGTPATELGVNVGENQYSAEASAINNRSVDEMNSRASQRDAEIDARARAEQTQIRRNRRDGKADWTR